jgi:TPR repeat protein
VQALRLSPSANRFQQLGDYYQETGQIELAIAYFDEAMLWGSADAAGSMMEILSGQLQEATTQQRPAIEQKIAHVAEYGLQQFSAETMFYLGSIEFFQRTNAQAKSRAYRWWRQAGQWGHRTAILNLGLAHFDGIHGQELNKPLAIGYFTEAAKLGNIGAHEHLGRSYLRGDGVAANYERAAYHLEIAADNDNVYAMRDWVFCLWMGRGTPQDRAAAQKVLERLKTLNVDVHQIALERIGLRGGVMTWLKNLLK